MAIGMTRREQWALIGVVTLIALGLGIEGWRRSNTDGPVVYVPGQGRWEKVADFEAGKRPGLLASPTTASMGLAGGVPGATQTVSSGIDLNLATAEELDRLPGVGPARAVAILELRQRLGAFSAVDQLDLVAGIGGKTLERLRPYVSVAAKPTTASAVNGSVSPVVSTVAGTATPAAEAVGAAEVEIIDINQAGEGELQKIKGIGPALAGRIVEDRRLHGPYRSVAELIRVKGIGATNLQKMRPQIRIGGGGRQ